jgi:hypothetical protein
VATETVAVAAFTTRATEVATGAADAMGRSPPRPVDDVGREAGVALATDAVALAIGAAVLATGAAALATGPVAALATEAAV